MGEGRKASVTWLEVWFELGSLPTSISATTTYLVLWERSGAIDFVSYEYLTYRHTAKISSLGS